MPYPKPKNGLVISYSYLWQNESKTGQLEGLKNRPSAIILVVEKSETEQIVTVAPVQIYAMNSTSRKHNLVSGNIYRELSLHSKNAPLKPILTICASKPQKHQAATIIQMSQWYAAHRNLRMRKSILCMS